jgi:CRISP-associated protein Cas1
MTTLPTAIVARQGARIHLDGGRLLIEHADQPTAELPLGQIGGLVLLGRIECSTGALLALADRGLTCVLATGGGRIRAVLTAPSSRGASLRSTQHELESMRCRSDGSHPAPLRIARSIVATKIDAILGILAQHHRTHDDIELSGPIEVVRTCRQRSVAAASIDQLRGFEGAAAAQYFACMPALCRGELSTATRTRQPPRDPLNAALSFGYSLLAGELTAVIVARGLDPALGLIHPPADGRPSLALDLVEPLRHAIVDRMVLRAANRRELVQRDFETAPANTTTAATEGVRFTDAGRAKFMRIYQDAMDGEMVAAGQSRRTIRSLLSDAVEAYETELSAIGQAHPAARSLSELSPDAVTRACDSTNSNSTSTSPPAPGLTDTPS